MLISILNKKKYNRIAATRRTFFFAVLIMLPLSLMGWRLVPAAGSNTEASSFVQSLYFITDKTVNALRFTNPFNWLNLLFLGICASGICFTTWSKACNIIGTVKVSCGLYLIPIVTTFFAFFVLGEKITLLGAAGSVITIAGLFISEK